VALYETALVIVGVAVLGIVVLPRVLSHRPLSFPIVYVAFGMAVFALPLGLPTPDPIQHGGLTERLTELGVIVALMGAGLKIDRPIGMWRWQSTWRLLVITMPLTIAVTALLGWLAVGLAVPTAVLLGAVVAPTDPVLASDVQVDPPEEGVSDEVRFALTSEAGLNDGLAFPFTYMAISMATLGVAPENWLHEWVVVDVFYKIIAGVVIGWIVGKAIAKYIFRVPAATKLAAAMAGVEALAATFVSYGITEIAYGYGFIAVFVTALTIRGHERHSDYHDQLHEFSEVIERLVTSILLVLFGGALVTGLLAPLSLQAIAVGVVVVVLIRPLAGIIGLFGYPNERNAIAFFGIRGIGSFYYLAYGINNATFPGAEMVWAIVGVVVLSSIVTHGSTAAPVMSDLRREATDLDTT
jgi:NhaP-type Na+/H+ or K+/H+ antiporter